MEPCKIDLLRSTLVDYGRVLAGAKSDLTRRLKARYDTPSDMRIDLSRLVSYSHRSIASVDDSANYRAARDAVLARVRRVLEELRIFDNSWDVLACSDDVTDGLIEEMIQSHCEDGVGENLNGTVINVFEVSLNGFLGFEELIERDINKDWCFFAHLTDCRTHVLPFGKNGDLPVTVHQLTYMIHLQENR